MKTRKFMAMIIAAVTCLGAFTACGDDDNNGGGSSAKTVKSVEAELTIYYPKTMLDYVDVKGTYQALDGTSYTVTPSSTTTTMKYLGEEIEFSPLTAKYTYTSFPAVFTMNVTYSIKSTPTEKITMLAGTYVGGTTTYSDGSTAALTSASISFKGGTGIKPENFESYLSTLQKTTGSLSLSINKDGKANSNE